MRPISVKRSSARWVAVCLLFTLLVWPAAAQEDAGRGVIIYRDESSVPFTGFEAFNCDGLACARLLSLLYPTLFDDVLADAPALPIAEQTYTVNDGLTWSDGVPITAYDVAYSLLSRPALVVDAASPLAGVRVDDETHVTLAFSDVDCATQAHLDGLIIPAHSLNPRFGDFADEFSGPESDLASPVEWRDAFAEWSNRSAWLRFPQGGAILPTAGKFSRVIGDGRDLNYYMRDGLVIDTATGSLSPIQQFLRGDINLLLDVPVADRVDLRATPGIQLYEVPGYAVDYLVFNQSDPNYPRPAFIDGEPLEQLPHPYFSDVRVRQAIQLAIDVPALIDGALYGGGVPVNGAFSPMSWAYDPELEPPVYDPGAAKRLLDEAGWRDVNGDGFRECFNCMNAFPDTSLSIQLVIDPGDGRDRVGDMLRTQLARIGVDLYVGGGDGAQQNFDLLLTGTGGGTALDHDPDLYRLFAQEWDRIRVGGGNVGSVNNPPLEALLDEARHVPACDLDARATIYGEVQELLREDVPAIWLYARHDLYVARGIDGFAPRPGQPFWNISDWVVTR